jgi:hypothetical protein
MPGPRRLGIAGGLACREAGELDGTNHPFRVNRRRRSEPLHDEVLGAVDMIGGECRIRGN